MARRVKLDSTLDETVQYIANRQGLDPNEVITRSINLMKAVTDELKAGERFEKVSSTAGDGKVAVEITPVS